MFINCCINKILNLEPVKSSNNIKGLKALYDKCEINVRNLSVLNATSGYGHLSLPILLKLLPENLVLEFHRKTRNEEEVNVPELLAFIKDELSCPNYKLSR